MHTIGIIVNPVAGMGGSVALKGTDGENTLRRALELGAVPRAERRMTDALKAASPLPEKTRLLTCGGAMGENVLASLGLPHEVIYRAGSATTADDTRAAARAIAAAGAELIFFAGGDGTARDLCAVLGSSLPVIGVPAGVKIHSAVYAVDPRSAGQLLRSYASGQPYDLTDAEVMDIDEDAFREGKVSARLFGYMKTPRDARMQCRKSGAPPTEDYERSAIGSFIADEMLPGRLYLIGSGTTTQSIMTALGLDGTLLGVDAVKDGQLIARDLTEKDLLRLIEPGNTTLVITVIGGQGHIFGRGNQQLSPAVLRAVGLKNITVAATPGKLNALFPRPLLADTGDPDLDTALRGYISVVTGYGQYHMCKVGN